MPLMEYHSGLNPLIVKLLETDTSLYISVENEDSDLVGLTITGKAVQLMVGDKRTNNIYIVSEDGRLLFQPPMPQDNHTEEEYNVLCQLLAVELKTQKSINHHDDLMKEYSKKRITILETLHEQYTFKKQTIETAKQENNTQTSP